MFEVAVLVGTVLLVFSYADWRNGMVVMVLVGFAQDLLRKVTPGEPVYITVLVGVFFGAAFLGALSRGMPLSLTPILRWHRGLRWPLTLFLLLVLIQIGVGFARTGSIFLAGIGFIGYFAPVMALMLAFRYALHTSGVSRLLHVYVVVGAVMCAGVYLEVFGVESSFLGSVGEGVATYPSSGGVLDLPAGFFRSAENAAWHAASAFCLLVVLVVSRQWRGGTATAVVLGLITVGAVLLTGRRKALLEIVLFVSVYGAFLLLASRAAAKSILFLLSLLIAVGTLQLMFFWKADRTTFLPYTERTSASSLDDATDRFRLMGVGAVQWSISRNGFFGAGAGLGGQGAQHFAGGARLVGGGAEGGLGKIAAELGVPGLLLFAWVAWGFLRSFRGAIRAPSVGRGAARVAIFGYLSFIAVNGAVFVAAAQIFGDPFVLLMLGFLVGVVLAGPAAGALRQQRAAFAVGGEFARTSSLKLVHKV